MAEKINEFQKPYSTTQEEQILRWACAKGEITERQFNMRYKKLLKAGKIIRSGKVERK